MKKTPDQAFIEKAKKIIAVRLQAAEDDGLIRNQTLGQIEVIFNKLHDEPKRTPAEQLEIISLCLKTLQEMGLQLNDEVYTNSLRIGRLNEINSSNSNAIKAIDLINCEIAELYKERDLTEKNRPAVRPPRQN